MSAPEPMLEVSGLEVRHGSVPAVRGIDLSVGHGEIVGLIGQRRGEIDDAPHDHGRHAAEPETFASEGPRSGVAPRADRPCRDRSRSRGEAYLRGTHGRGESSSRALGASDEIRRG